MVARYGTGRGPIPRTGANGYALRIAGGAERVENYKREALECIDSKSVCELIREGVIFAGRAALEFVRLSASVEEWRQWCEANGESVPDLDERTALNGAHDWSAWAYGGCGLVYDAYIAERLCTPSELRKLDGGARVPAGAATWCDIEARAAWQAWRMIAEAVRKLEA